MVEWLKEFVEWLKESMGPWVVAGSLTLLALLAILVVLALLTAAILRHAKRPREAKPEKDKPPHEKHEKKASGESHQPAHGHDSHGTKNGWGLLQFSVGLLVLTVVVFWVIVPGLRHAGFFQTAHTRGHGNVGVAAQAATSISLDPGTEISSLECHGASNVIAVLKPKESLVLHLPDRTQADLYPDVASGAISVCSYYDPTLCAGTGNPLFRNISLFTVTNIRTEGEIPFACQTSSIP